MVRLRRERVGAGQEYAVLSASAALDPVLDREQRAAVDHRGPLLRVVGAPGTGCTTTAVEIVVDRVRAGELRADECVVVGSSRIAAAGLRSRITARLGGTSTEPLARTLPSLAFGILRRAATLRGDPAPRLLSGPEQDVILGELLEGHTTGDVPAPPWPERVHLALPTRAFRDELRDLLMRAVEHDLDPAGLARLGHDHDRPDWIAASRVLAEYDEVTALAAPSAYDPARILGAAADELLADPAELERLHRRLRLVVVDDAQEITPSAARFLGVLAGPGVDLVLLGDPDSTVQGFRGADPTFFASRWDQLGAAAVTGHTVTLRTSHRLPKAVQAVAERVAGHIGVIGSVEHRRPTPRPEQGEVEVHVARSAHHEASLITTTLRRAHLVDGVAWSDMVVIVRGHGRSATLRRSLLAGGVPVTMSAAEVPVRDEVAVRPLLTLLEAAARNEDLTPDQALDVLTSPIGGADAMTLRRVRRQLRRAELTEGGSRPSSQLLAAAVSDAGLVADLGQEAEPVRRVARALRAGRDALTSIASDGSRVARPGIGVDEALWAMWSATRVAKQWRDAALAGGVAGARADRDLDAVVALFDAAARFCDRLPGAPPRHFLDHVRQQAVAGDTLVARAAGGERVSVITPQSAAGQEWSLVVVAGVQEGVWPDLRLRGSLLGGTALVDVVRGRDSSWRAARAAVRHDETRLFHVAVTRARQRLVVTAVSNDDDTPSALLDVVDPPPGGEPRPYAVTVAPMTLSALVAGLRRDVVTLSSGERGVAARDLARLAAARVVGADPAEWWSLAAPTDDRPLRQPDQSVPVSPSRVESFTTCPLKWLLTTRGGDGPSVGAAAIGTLVHDVAADLGDVSAEELKAEIDERWPRLGLPAGWVNERKRTEAHHMAELLARYTDLAREQGWTKLGAEIPVDVVVGRAELHGRVDRLERLPDGSLRVIDYKTGSSRPSRSEVARHPQLGCYQVAVEKGVFAGVEGGGSTSGGAALLQIGKRANKKGSTLDEQVPLAADPEPGWAEQLVTETADGMSAARFAAILRERECDRCPVRSSCPARAEGARLW